MKSYFQSYNTAYQERYEYTLNQTRTLLNSISSSKYEDYFKDAATFIIKMGDLEKDLDNYFFESKSIDELKSFNMSLYQGLIGMDYEMSYANTDYCVQLFGLDIGQVLAFLYTTIRNYVSAVFEHRIVNMTIINELFLEVYNCITSDDTAGLKELVEQSMLEDIETRLEINLLRRMDPNFNVYKDILLNADLSDNRYLYQYGKYITGDELQSAEYLREIDQERIELMASTYTKAFIQGYRNGNKNMPIEDKRTVNLGYQLGFERVERLAAMDFAKMNLESLVFDDAFTAARNRLVYSKPSKQYPYDHRHDMALYFTKDYVDTYKEAYARVLEKHKELMKQMAGPAIQESFGDAGFSPITKKHNIQFDEDQTEKKNQFDAAIGQLMSNYLPRSEYSFVIISYPLPQIGEKYEEIFDEIIKVNTLDSDVYERIHESIIDILDIGVYVRVKGKGDNRTDMKVMLYELQDSSKETIFENCIADVNVPVGEVFTSPKLAGTKGTLHVSQVYLNGLKYENIELTFVDGMVDTYTCSNFGDDEDANKKYVYENLIHPHKTLPIGEFAIGTNTTAYVMAEKYQIANLLPILIAEKMGPHFAIGDTCFSWSEDISVYNSNGKEIIARDNERSILRKEDVSKAYTFKHTDITIPYDEIGLIEVVTHNGEHIDIIRNGRFVLPGATLLNAPFKE
ncbi:MAG: aminopeptidase [Vallitaleaceae bacterium]|jgi:aminopeptidase|nr:aminopeptidase [Vallitaleaceae bacterium]